MTEAPLLRSQEYESSAVRKALMRLVPFLALLYMFNILDRGNVSVAALTMQKDLKFSDAVYGFGAGIFFVGYFFFEVPSNLIMQKVGARRWICRIMLSWGVVSTSMMFVRSPMSFYALRFLLGVAEAGFFPGIILYLTYWFPCGVRAQVMARFLALSSVLGLAGGPLGGAILTLKGLGGLAGWQWLFIVEGVPSILFGFVVLKFLPDGPAKANWLLPEEKQALSERLAEDAKETGRVEHLSVWVALSNPKIRLMCIIFFLSATAGNAVGFFRPETGADAQRRPMVGRLRFHYWGNSRHRRRHRNGGLPQDIRIERGGGGGTSLSVIWWRDWDSCCACTRITRP